MGYKASISWDITSYNHLYTVYIYIYHLYGKNVCIHEHWNPGTALESVVVSQLEAFG